jgi:pyruvate,phosphate dikinase
VHADERRRLGVWANSDTGEDSARAVRFGAEGIGLCRTEHMFFDGDRIVAMREMIMAETSDGRRAALAKILPMQRADFVELFEIMKGLPVTIRLLDPPLHEFLPNTDAEMDEVAKASGVAIDTVKHRAAMLKESNPMLGHRGCRLGITYPEVYEMQVRAIFEAAAHCVAEKIDVRPEVMIPLVGTVNEFTELQSRVRAIAAAVFAKTKTAIAHLVGTMIEVPRACLVAEAIAKEAEFFSFGTNDLTQMTFGYSRDDAEGKPGNAGNKGRGKGRGDEQNEVESLEAVHWHTPSCPPRCRPRRRQGNAWPTTCGSGVVAEDLPPFYRARARDQGLRLSCRPPQGAVEIKQSPPAPHHPCPRRRMRP